MIPNKTEQQILYQNFKFFDLEGAGFCNLKDFIRTNEKIGVVLSHMQDFQDIFNYFDTDHCGVINYKQFCKIIFNLKDQNYQRNQKIDQPPQNFNYQEKRQESPSNWDKEKKTGPFFDKLVNILLQKGGARALISLCKEFKLLDFNSSNRLTIDDFIKIISENKINLSISDIQLLFHSYELNNNGLFYYDEMFKDLKNLFWNSTRAKFISDIFTNLTKVKSNIMVSDLKSMFDPKGHPYCREIGAPILYEDFQAIVDCYLCIKRMNRGNFQLSKNDLEDFFKFYSFGIEGDDTFMDILANCFYLNKPEQEYNNNNQYNQYTEQFQNNNQRPLSRPKTPTYTANINNYVNQNQITQQCQVSTIEPIIGKLKKSLQKFGLKTFFGLMKHFKYYDNGTKMITKYDFAKVLKDFRLNLTVSEIEKIFDNFCKDSKKIQLNYEDFISSLTSNQISDIRVDSMGEIYDKLNAYAKSIGEKLSVDLIKSMYWSKENLFGMEENQALNEFCDNIEMYHYSIKGNKLPLVSRDEFIDFYKIVSFIIDTDDDFLYLINTEWKKVLNEPNIPKKGNSQIKEITRQQEQDYDNNYRDLQQNLQQNPQQRPRTPILQQREDEMESQNATMGTKSQLYMRQKPNSRSQTSIKRNVENNGGMDPLRILEEKLRRRGIRGLMYLHRQFLFSCTNLATISFNDFIKVLTLQRLDLQKEDYEILFSKYCQEENNSYLNFPNFIRAFKKILNDKRLEAVEKAFGHLDREQTESLFIDDIKLRFNPSNHPEVLQNIKNEDEIITEFLDCFELNYNLLTTAENPETSNMVSFEEFANFYEYVSFLYERDSDFIKLVEGSWNY